MKRFNVFGQEFKIIWTGESAGYIQTAVLSDGKWVNISGADPTILTFGKDKMQCLQLLKEVLVIVFERLRELYGESEPHEETAEPENVDDFINWILSEKTEFTESGFNVNY